MYIGKTPTVGNFQVCDAISVVNGQAAYTLQVGGVNVAPESANHMLVSLNGILQKPGSSFTISGSTMTFASNLATGDVIDFVQILGNVLDIGQPSDDTVTAAKLATTSITGQTAETSAADADTILIHDDSASALRKMTRSNFLSGVGGVNTPAFSAERSSAQSISDATRTTILFNNEFLDSSSAYDTSTGKFTPQTAGKYFVIANIILQSGSNSNFSFGFVELYKNSSVITESVFDDRGDENSRCYTAAPSAVVDMNGSSDFILIQAYINANSGTPEVSDMSTFTAFKIIE